MSLDEERLRILSVWHDGPRSLHRLVIGATSRLLHVSGPEAIPYLIHPGAQAITLRMVWVDVDREEHVGTICVSQESASGTRRTINFRESEMDARERSGFGVRRIYALLHGK